MDLQERVEQEQRGDVHAVLSSEKGRRLLWRVLCHCGVYQDINSDDEMVTSRKLGQRSIGLWLMQIIGDIDQDKLFLMMKEARTRDEELQILAEREISKLDESKSDDIEFNVDSYIS